MLTSIVGGLLSLGTSIFDQINKNNNAKKRISNYQDSLNDLLVTDAEADKLKKGATVSSNTAINNILNSNAITSSRFGNSGVAKAVGIAPALAQQTKSLFDIDMSLFENNQQTKYKLAESELMDPGQFNLGDTIASGISGFQAGTSINDYLNQDENYLKKLQMIKAMDLTNSPLFSGIPIGII